MVAVVIYFNETFCLA